LPLKYAVGWPSVITMICGLELGRFLSVGDVVELDGGPNLGVLANTVRQREGRR
jgi:hypothetical protein